MRNILMIVVPVLAIVMTSCNQQELQRLNNEVSSLNKTVDSLQNVNAEMLEELNGYRYSPAKLLANIQENYKNKRYDFIYSDLDLLSRYHPESTEYAKAKSIYDQSLKAIELERKKAAEEAAKEEAIRKAKMAPIERTMEKYNCSEEIAGLILKRRVRLGMTKEQCKAAWGRPEDINRTTGSWGVHEQWCYGSGNYLYFEDGVLTSIQN